MDVNIPMKCSTMRKVKSLIDILIEFVLIGFFLIIITLIFIVGSIYLFMLQNSQYWKMIPLDLVYSNPDGLMLYYIIGSICGWLVLLIASGSIKLKCIQDE